MATAFQHGLTAYTLGASSTTAHAYDQRVDTLNFTTTSPGGYGDLSVKLHVPDARLVPPELRIFANVALMDGPLPLFLGRWDEPGIVVNTTDGDVLQLHAMGGGHNLTDDADDATYTNQTALYILSHEISRRANYLAIDQDMSLVLPDNPSTAFNGAYNGKNVEEILNELLPVLGDYTWGVWGHGTHKDAFGFPTWQLQVHKRDASTIHYRAGMGDIVNVDVRPAVEWSYNVVTLKYRDFTTGAASTVTVKDNRLNANGSQGSAPFPWRRLYKDLSHMYLSSAQANTLANTLLQSYQNGGYKIQIDLQSVRDGNGVPIPLWQVRADRNILLTDLATFGVQLPIAVTNQAPNATLFYLTETEYKEQAGTGSQTTPTLTIHANTFSDHGAFLLSRLTYYQERRGKDQKLHHKIQAVGEPESGSCGFTFPNGTTGVTNGGMVNLKTQTAQVSSSITLTVGTSLNVSGTPSVNQITDKGFNMFWFPAANGQTYWNGTYTTVGNCLLDVDEAAATFDHHCDRCERERRGPAIRRGLSLKRDLIRDVSYGDAPGLSALAYVCPTCGDIECFNTNLGPEDEADPHDGNPRATFAALIRRAQAHPHVGLRRKGDPVQGGPKAAA